MRTDFVEGTLVMLGIAIVLVSVLSVGGVVSGDGYGQGYVPVRTAGSGADSGEVSFDLGGTTAPRVASSVSTATGNILFGIGG